MTSPAWVRGTRTGHLLHEPRAGWLRGTSIELWTDHRSGEPTLNPVMQALLAELRAAGAIARVRVPDHEVASAAFRETADLVLLATTGPLAVARARAGEAQGLRCLNGAAVTLRALDRAAVVGRLAAAGVPLPPTWLVPDRSATDPIHPGEPVRGWVARPALATTGGGIAIGDSPARAAAAARAPANEPLVLQPEVGGEGPELRVYVAGEALFAGWRRWGPHRDAGGQPVDDVEPTALGSHEQAVVRRVGGALGLRCYRVDLRLETDGTPLVVGVKSFPGYHAFPEAVEPLLREVEHALRGGGRLEREAAR